MDLQTLWFVLIAVLWTGYLVLEGFDFGVGILLHVVGRDRGRARAGDPLDRPGVGRQRGVAARRGRGDLRRLPGVVRDAIQRLLPRADADPGRADRAGHGARVPQQARRSGLAAPLGRRDRRLQRAAGAAVGRRVRQHRRRQPTREDGTFAGDFLDLLRPYTILGGLTTLLLFALHGAHFLALAHGRPGARARQRGGHARCGSRPSRSSPPSRSGRCSTPRSCARWRVAATGVAAVALVAVIAMHRAGREGCGVRPHDGGDRGRRRAAVRDAVPERDGVVRARAGPQHRRRRVDPLHAGGHDRRRGRHDPDRAHLPGLDLLGVPRAHLRGQARATSRRRSTCWTGGAGRREAPRAVACGGPSRRCGGTPSLAAVLRRRRAAAIAAQAIFLGAASPPGSTARGWSAAARGVGLPGRRRGSAPPSTWIAEVRGRRAGERRDGGPARAPRRHDARGRAARTAAAAARASSPRSPPRAARRSSAGRAGAAAGRAGGCSCRSRRSRSSSRATRSAPCCWCRPCRC